MVRKISILSRLGSGAALALALAACGPDDAQNKLANVEWPLSAYGIDAGAPSNMSLAPLPEAEPMVLDDRPAPGGAVGQVRNVSYGYAPQYFDDAYANDYDEGWYDEAPSGNSYGLIALASVLGGVLANSPPDYGFAYDGVEPWAWETGDHYRRYAEPIPGGWRTYYYAPEADYPFLVRDPYYAYGYQGERVAVIYDRHGRVLDPGRAWRQRQIAGRYYDRGFDLYRASRSERRIGVAAPVWAQRREQLWRAQQDWDRARDRQRAWQDWDRRHDDVITARWTQERAVRTYAANRFDRWRQQDFRGTAPRFYREAGQDPQLRKAVLAKQARLYRQARQEQLADARDARQDARQNGAHQRQQAQAIAERRADSRQALLLDRRQLAMQQQGDRVAQQRQQQVRQQQTQRQQVAQQRQALLADRRQQASQQRQSRVAERRQQVAQQRQARAVEQRQQIARQRQARAAEQRQQVAQQRRSRVAEQRQQIAEQRQARAAGQRQQVAQQRQAQAAEQRQQLAERRQSAMAQQRQQVMQQRQQAMQARQQARAEARGPRGGGGPGHDRKQ